jgi:hypothetical protein
MSYDWLSFLIYIFHLLIKKKKKLNYILYNNTLYVEARCCFGWTVE